MTRVEGGNFFNRSMLVINKYFQVVIAQHVQIDLVPVISNPHHKRSLLVQCLDLVVQGKPFKLRPRNHA